MTRKKLVVGNWKMNCSRQMVEDYFSALKFNENASKEVDIALCIPTPYLTLAGEKAKSIYISYGAQDVSTQQPGAHTGDVSAQMLADLGCTYVIVGHSERRANHRESNQEICQKIAVTINAGMAPIFCVGESLYERQAEISQRIVLEQINSVFSILTREQQQKCAIAYEPIWAIGTGLSATPAQAQEIHSVIRTYLNQLSPEHANSMKILYGGSVKPDSAKLLFNQKDIDGGLIGGASLIPNDFAAIVNAAV